MITSAANLFIQTKTKQNKTNENFDLIEEFRIFQIWPIDLCRKTTNVYCFHCRAFGIHFNSC